MPIKKDMIKAIHKILIRFGLTFILLVNINQTNAQATDNNQLVSDSHHWYVPDEYNIQYAGGIGYFSAGIGYTITPRYTHSMYYGYLSKNFGGSINAVHTVSLKHKFTLTRKPLWNHLYPTAGGAINVGFTNNTFDKLPGYYPKNYYFQNKVHLAPFVGAELRFKLKNYEWINYWGAYFELSSFDNYILECARTEYVTLAMITNLSIGLRINVN